MVSWRDEHYGVRYTTESAINRERAMVILVSVFMCVRLLLFV